MSARLAGLAVLLAATLLEPVAGLADVAPDSVLRERTDTHRWNRYRVVTSRSTFELGSLHADPTGIVLQTPPRRPAIFATPELRPDTARYVRWSEIEHVDAAHSNAGKGALEGAIVGGIVGVSATFLIASGAKDESALAAIGVTPLGIVFGALAGAGFFGGSRWTRIWP